MTMTIWMEVVRVGEMLFASKFPTLPRSRSNFFLSEQFFLSPNSEGANDDTGLNEST